MVDAPKGASGRVYALNAGSGPVAPFFSNIGQAVRRGEFFAGLFILGFSNGIFERITWAVQNGTVENAVLGTLGISVLVWVACFIAVSLLLRQPAEPLTRFDLILGVAVTAAVLVPAAKVSWIALTGLGIYGMRCFEAGSPARRAAFVILAVTVPMFWSRLLFAILSDFILQADAVLVSLIVGTERVGNTVPFPDNSGYLFIMPGCSSLADVSLAVLGWALFTQALTRRPSVKDVWWCLAACSAVIAINVTRIALIGLYPKHFQLIHGAVGAGVASFLALVAIVGINLIRVRGDVLARS
jgi:exosortase/archaeosortase family protein